MSLYVIREFGCTSGLQSITSSSPSKGPPQKIRHTKKKITPSVNYVKCHLNRIPIKCV